LVTSAAQQGAYGGVVGGRDDADLGLGVPGAEGPQDRGQPREGGAALRGEADVPVPPLAHLAQVAGDRLQFAEHLTGRHQHPAAGGVRDQAAAAALEQAHAETVFEPGQPLAEGGLADEEPLGGGGEAAGLGGGGDQFEIPQVHIHCHNRGL
jgi:hypothetical protein